MGSSVCVHTRAAGHTSATLEALGALPDWFYLGLDPMFGSRCWAYGKVLQEGRAEEPASLGGFRISHPRAVQGLLELKVSPGHKDGLETPHRPGLGVPTLQQSRSPSSPRTLRKRLVSATFSQERLSCRGRNISEHQAVSPPLQSSGKVLPAQGWQYLPRLSSAALWDQKGSFARGLVPGAQAAVQLHGWKQEQQTICWHSPFHPTGVCPQEASGVISKISQLVEFTASQPSVADKSSSMLSSVQKEQSQSWHTALLRDCAAPAAGVALLESKPGTGEGLTHPPWE